MKRVVIGILISVLMIGSVFVSANTTNYKNDNSNQIYSFNIEDGEISITILVGDYEIIHGDQGDEVTVEDFGRLLIPGKPKLPSKIFSVAIPPGAIFVDYSFDSGENIILDGSYNIIPVDLPRVIGQEDPEIYKQEQMKYKENHESVYGNDDPYPSSVVEFVRIAGFRKYNLVDLRVNPFSYCPISGQLTLYPKITVTISYTFPKSFTYNDIMVDYTEKTKSVAEKIAYNYDQTKDWYPKETGNKETYDYVIITLDSLTSYVNDLVDWEEEKGRSVKVVNTSWIDSNYNGYDLAEKIRNFLREKYPSEEWGILDVCLIGYYDHVPMRLTEQNVGYGRPETDYYYAELSLPDNQSWDLDGDHQYGESYDDQIDFTAEVNVGRIPWSGPATVDHICEKSVAYEMNTDPTFKKNILLLGAFFWHDTDNAVLMEYKTDSDIHPWMEDWTMTRMYEEWYSAYPMDYNLNWNNVKDVWSAGKYAFVDWAGHGSYDACYKKYPNQPFVDTDTCTYLNDDYPAIIFADACSNSDTSHLNLGQAMMKHGAVGFLGATKVAFGAQAWDDPTDGSSQTLDYFFTTCVTSGEYTQGQAHQYALREMYTKGFWYPQTFMYEMFEWGSLWGNPDISMANVEENEPPTSPVLDGPRTGEPGIDYCWTFRSDDPEGDQIKYIINWDDGNTTEIDCQPPGTSVEVYHTYAEEGYYNITAKAVGCLYGQESEWSDPFLFNVPRTKFSINSIYLKFLEIFIDLFQFLQRLII